VDAALAIQCILLTAAVYPFVLYPLLLRFLSRRIPREASGLPSGDLMPPVTMIVCALNEERIIRQKLENTLELDYPPGRLRAVFISDGSTDATNDILREYSARGIDIVIQPHRRGKVTNLNEAVPSAPTELVVLSDANVLYRADSLRWLLRHFADPEVGGVSGKVELVKTAEALSQGESGYYSIEWSLFERESLIHSMVGSDGAMYAIRKQLFTVCPTDTIIEDFIVALGIPRRGKRMLFEPRATAVEEGPSSLREEYRRKVRIAAGAAQGLLRGNGLPWGAPVRFWFLYASHKLLRWLSPVSGLALLLWSAAFSELPLSPFLLAGFAALVVAAATRLATGRSNRLLDAPFYFVFGQVAVLVGLSKGLLGKQSVLWAKANR
jgi:cellulose synthase/poly-beta-1,6-N-acetylglucosamine synthase-like glycosyltransferase